MSGRWESRPFVDARTPPEGCLLPSLILDFFKVFFLTLYHGQPPLTDHLGEYVLLFPSILMKQIQVLQRSRLPQLPKLKTSGNLGPLVNCLRSRKKSHDEDRGMIDCLGISNGCAFFWPPEIFDYWSLIFLREFEQHLLTLKYWELKFFPWKILKKEPFQKGKACVFYFSGDMCQVSGGVFGYSSGKMVFVVTVFLLMEAMEFK